MKNSINYVFGMKITVMCYIETGGVEVISDVF